MFSLDAKGNTLYDSLKAAERAGIKPKELIEFENTILPSDCAEAWQDFLELSNSRQYTADGPCSISYRDIGDWGRVVGKEYSAFQSDVLFAIDKVWTKHYYENQEKIKKQMSSKNKKR